MLASLPEEEAEQARPEVESLHNKLALLADGVALQPTRKRSGKQLTKQSKRSDDAKLVHPLFPGRSKKGKRKQAGASVAEVSDALPNLRQKLEGSKKVREGGCGRARGGGAVLMGGAVVQRPTRQP